MKVNKINYIIRGRPRCLTKKEADFVIVSCHWGMSQGGTFSVAPHQRAIGQAAIRAGATGAVTFLFDGKTLKFPGVAEPVSKRSPMTFEQLMSRLRMRRGDVILIAFAGTWWEAARGGFAAIRTLE